MLSVAMSLSSMIEPASAGSGKKAVAETSFADSLQEANGFTLPVFSPVPQTKATSQGESKPSGPLSQTSASQELTQGAVSVAEKDVKPTASFADKAAVVPSNQKTEPTVSEPSILPASSPRVPAQTASKGASAPVPSAVSASAGPVPHTPTIVGAPQDSEALEDATEAPSPSLIKKLPAVASSLPETPLRDQTQAAGLIADAQAGTSTIVQSATARASQQVPVAQAPVSVVQATGDAEGGKPQAIKAKKSETSGDSVPAAKHTKTEPSFTSPEIVPTAQAVPVSVDVSPASVTQVAPVLTTVAEKEPLSAVTNVSQTVTAERSPVALGNVLKGTASLPVLGSTGKSDSAQDADGSTSITTGAPFAAAIQVIQDKLNSGFTQAAATPATSQSVKPVESPHRTASTVSPVSISTPPAQPSVSTDSPVAASSSPAQQAILLPLTKSGSTEPPAPQPQMVHPSKMAEVPTTAAHSTHVTDPRLPDTAPNGVTVSHQAVQETSNTPGTNANLGAIGSGDNNITAPHGLSAPAESVQSLVPAALGVDPSTPIHVGGVTIASRPSDGTPVVLPHTSAGSQVGGYQDMQHQTLQATPTVLEVGVPGGAHGWLKIRAELDDSGTVRASLAPSTRDGEDQMHRDLPGMAAFLEGEHLPVTLHVAHTTAPSSAFDLSDAGTGSLSRGPGDAGSTFTDAGSQQQARQERTAAGTGDLAAGSVRASTTDRSSPERDDTTWSPDAGYMGSKAPRGGAWLNVMA